MPLSSLLLKKHDLPSGTVAQGILDSWTLSLRAKLVTHFLNDWSLGTAGTPLNSSVKWVRLSSSDTISLWTQEINDSPSLSYPLLSQGKKHCLKGPRGDKARKVGEVAQSPSSALPSWLQSILIILAAPSLWEALSSPLR